MEFLDFTDNEDNVIGSAPKEEIYGKKLPHRIVHVFVFNDSQEMALSRRSSRVAFCPLHWCTAVAGHVVAGETYEDAAKREMSEEIGISANITYLNKDRYETGGLKKFPVSFASSCNGPFCTSPREVECVEFFSMQEIQRMIINGEKFHPETLFLLRRHFGIK